MYSLSVRDHMMIAHSFSGAVFGPAQNLHGATYVVEVTFRRQTLDADGLVVDIGAARRVLGDIVGEFDLRNLDEMPQLAGHNTTTEFMARLVFDRVRRAVQSGQLGEGARGLSGLAVTLHESPLAWASYEAELP